mgnify:FL=1
MKRALSLILSLMLVLALCGCGKASRPVSFPLDDDKIAVTVTELGLPWELSADECLSYSENQRTCVLRDTTETYAEGGSKLLRAAISSGSSGGGDYMFANFEGTPQTEEPEFDWAYWEAQLRLTEMLWGMEDGQLYNILSEKPEPDRVVSQDVSTQGTVDHLIWELTLESGERIDINWRCYPTTFTSSAQTGREVDDWGQHLSIRVFASEKVYDNIMEQAAKAAEDRAKE